jgi:uncharacterized protein YdeI (YjbR/CyaY-like superfamily)
MTKTGRGVETDPLFLETPSAFREWLELHHSTHRELWLGLHHRKSGTPGISYKEALDAALCFGWIDGVRKAQGPASYKIRFSPRRKSSIWSVINLRRVKELEKLGLMAEPGLKVYRDRDRRKQGMYSFENRPRTLPPRYITLFRKKKRALAYYRSQAWWYRRTTAWWILSAKREETQLRRLKILIDHCEKRIWLAALQRNPARARREA